MAAQGRQAPPPQQVTLTLSLYVDGYHGPVCLYADGYQPCNRPDINTKISLIYFEGLWFPLAGSLRRCTHMITWLELLKAVDAEWVPKRTKALHALPSCMFQQRMRYFGVKYTTALRV